MGLLSRPVDLTINQIMILLDIYRGTQTQETIGTVFQDCMKLNKLGLIEPSEEKDTNLKVTYNGQLLVEKIKEQAFTVSNKRKKDLDVVVCPYCSVEGNHCTDIEADTCVNNDLNPLSKPCCDNEDRSFNGGCRSCGDPCL